MVSAEESALRLEEEMEKAHATLASTGLATFAASSSGTPAAHSGPQQETAMSAIVEEHITSAGAASIPAPEPASKPEPEAIPSTPVEALKEVEPVKAEAPGILQWMIDGCVTWQAEGLNPPKAVVEATKAYLESEDALAAWIEDCCELSPSKFEPVGLLFASWRKWAHANGEKKIDNQKDFGRALDSRGIEPQRRGKGRMRVRLGIALTDEARSEAEESLKPRGWVD